VTKVEESNDDIIDLVKPPSVEEVEVEETTPLDDPHLEEPVVKPPTDLASNESVHFVSVGGSILIA